MNSYARWYAPTIYIVFSACSDKQVVSTKLALGFLVLTTTVAAQSTTASASPSSLTFNYQIGAALPAAQTVSVRASTGTPTYVLSITPPTDLWVTVTPDSGKTPATLSVLVNPTGLAVAQYTASIDVVVSGVTGTVSIPVTLNVTAPLPTLTLSANSATFVTSPTPTLSSTITLTTTSMPVTFTAQVSGASWLTVSPVNGVVLPGSDFALTLTADPTNLTPSAKAYTGKVAITANGVLASNKTQTITANLTVNPAQPTITSIWPSTVQANTGAATITIRGTNFYTGTTAKAGTTSLTATILSTDAMQAVVPATMLTAAGTVNLIVSNPAPGGDSTPAVLTVTNAPVIQVIVNSASYGNAGSVSPGEIVSLFGLGIGPATPVYMSQAVNPGFIDTVIGGLTITFDGVASPILYGDPNQITVQVPYEATQGSGKNVVVSNGTGTPSSTTVTIGPVAPGIFTANASGIGNAAAVVYPSSGGTPGINSATFPAHAGDTVALYLTGEGDYLTSPTPHTGYIIPSSLTPLPQMPTLPTVTIGGQAASVSYAGPLYGSIIGLLQINAVVPTGLTAGNVPLVVTIGGVTTQSSVTLAVK